MVIGVPDTALVAAQGFAEESGIPLREGLVRNRYVHRTFIQPTDGQRKQGVHMKFNPMPEVLQGKKVVVVDDTIVRGTSTRHIVKVLRQAGAKEVHVRIAAPPIRYPCYLGVDMPTRGELIASPFSSREEAEAVVSRFLEADSLGYLSIEGIVKATGLDQSLFCLACFNGEYPVPVQMELDKFALERPTVTAHAQ
jgi:amidophosphoribosyltransferase